PLAGSVRAGLAWVGRRVPLADRRPTCIVRALVGLDIPHRDQRHVAQPDGLGLQAGAVGARAARVESVEDVEDLPVALRRGDADALRRTRADVREAAAQARDAGAEPSDIRIVSDAALLEGGAIGREVERLAAGGEVERLLG